MSNSDASNRKLNIFELPYAQMAENSASNAAFALRIQGTFTPAMLRQAIDCVQRNTEGAAVRLVCRDGTYFFEKGNVPAVPLRIVQRTSDQEWIKEVEDELNRPFSDTGPLIRFVALLPEDQSAEAVSDLILTCHHAVGDLNSAFWLCEDVLETCQKIKDGASEIQSPVRRFPEISAESLPPALRGPRGERRTTIGSSWLEKVLKGADQLPVHASTRPGARVTRILYRELPAGMLWALEKTARRKGVSLQALFLAAQLISAAKLLRPDGSPAKIIYDSIEDAREAITPPIAPDRTGCLVLLLKFFSEVRATDDLLELAGQVSARLAEGRGAGDIFLNALIAGRVIPSHLDAGIHVESTLAMNCNGRIRFTFENAASFKVLANWSQASVHGHGSACLSSITEYGGIASWTAAFSEPGPRPETVNALIDGSLELLEQALKKTPLPLSPPDRDLAPEASNNT